MTSWRKLPQVCLYAGLMKVLLGGGLLLAALGLAACESSSVPTVPDATGLVSTTTPVPTTTTGEPSTTTTVPGSTTTTSSSTTITTLVGPNALPWLTVDALAGLEFGLATSADALEVVVPLLGAPDGPEGTGCEGLAEVRWHDLSLYFENDELAGWWYRGDAGLATPSGVEPFVTEVTDLHNTYDEAGLHVVTNDVGLGTFTYVLPTSKGLAYLGGHIARDVVTSLFAGVTCLGPAPLYPAPQDLALDFYNRYIQDEEVFFVATTDAIDWIRENGGRDRGALNADGVLLSDVSLEHGGDPSGCWLFGDVTITCAIGRVGGAAGLEDLAIHIQDIARPGPDPDDQWLGAYIVVGASFLSDLPLDD